MQALLLVVDHTAFACSTSPTIPTPLGAFWLATSDNLPFMCSEISQVNCCSIDVISFGVVVLDTICVGQIWLNMTALQRRDRELFALTSNVSLPDATQPFSVNEAGKSPPPVTSWPGQVWCKDIYSVRVKLSRYHSGLTFGFKCGKLRICPVTKHWMCQIIIASLRLLPFYPQLWFK